MTEIYRFFGLSDPQNEVKQELKGYLVFYTIILVFILIDTLPVLKTGDQLIIPFHYLGIMALIIHCLLYCVGFQFNKKRLIILSLTFAICGLSFLIVNVVLRVMWNQNITRSNSILWVFIFSSINNNGVIIPDLDEFYPHFVAYFQSLKSNVNLPGWYFALIAIELIYVIYRLENPYQAFKKQENRLNIPHSTESLQESKNIKEKDLIFPDLKQNRIYCSNCHEAIDRLSNFCGYCGVELKICQICKYPINKDKLATCPFCGAGFHRLEFLEWLKVKACCPVCQNEIDLWEFQEFEKKKVHEMENKPKAWF